MTSGRRVRVSSCNKSCKLYHSAELKLTSGWLCLPGTIEELTPWYAFYRDLLLNKRPRTEYETFGHPVACEPA